MFEIYGGAALRLYIVKQTLTANAFNTVSDWFNPSILDWLGTLRGRHTT